MGYGRRRVGYQGLELVLYLLLGRLLHHFPRIHITPTSQVRDWLRSAANLQLDRFQVQISSRRALLNTVIALNPDTFALAEATTSPNQCIKNRTLSEQATRWIDPILKPSADRTNWEAATLDALKEVATLAADDQVPEFFRGRNGGLSDVWQGKYKTEKGEDKYWKKFIVEGISVAASIRLQAGLPGRMVSRPSP